MRTLLLVLSVLSFASHAASAVAASFNATVVSAELETIWPSSDAHTLLAGGADGTLRWSDDNAAHWHQADIEGNARITHFAGADDKPLMFAISEEALLRSTDGGKHWQRIDLPEGHFVSDVRYVSALHTWFASTGLGILSSTDEGLTWKTVFHTSRKAPMLHLAQTPSGKLLAGGGLGQLAISEDGKHWRYARTQTDAILMHFVALPDGSGTLALWHDGSTTRISNDAKRLTRGNTDQTEAPYSAILDTVHRQILIGTAQGEIMRSTDGVRWSHNLIAERAYITDIRVAPRNGDIFAVGARANIVRSQDGGNTWQFLRGNEWSSRLNTLLITRSGELLSGGSGGLLLKSTDHGAHWQVLQPDLTRYVSESLSLPAAGALLLAGYDGLLARSEDGGEQWQLLETGMKTTLSIHPLLAHKDRLIAGAPLSTILISTDQGLHWQAKELADVGGNSFLRELAADGTTVLALGNPGPIIRSTDSGENWGVLGLAAGDDGFAAVCALGEGRFLIARNDGSVFRSDDSGQTWSMPEKIAKSLTTLHFDAHTRSVWAMGPVAFMRSDDLGAHWRAISLPEGAHPAYLQRTHAGTLLGFGDHGSIIRSVDDGNTWLQVGTLGSASLRKPLIDPKTQDIWVPGRDGTLLRSTDDGQHWSKIPTRTRAHLNRLVIDTRKRTLLVTGERVVRLDLE